MKRMLNVFGSWTVAAALASSAAGASLGSGFTYQGQLRQSGTPANGEFDFQFRLLDGPAGSPLGAPVVVEDWPVDDGLFTTNLDFGAAAFTSGQALWLEVSVRPGASVGAYTTLSPTQALTAAPFALYALNGGGDSMWEANGADIHNANAGDVGIGVDSPAATLDVTNAGGQPAIQGRSPWIGVFGAHNATTGSFPGVWGETDSTSSQANGVRGVVTSTTPGGNSAGVRGMNNGTGANGIGVWGSQNGSGWGVNGESVSGVGVRGVVTSTGGGAYGVWGSSPGNGTGVYGESLDNVGVTGKGTNTTGVNYGVWGNTASPDGFAGYFTGGKSYFSGPVGIGDTSPDAELDVTTTSGHGIIGTTSASSSYGVYGVGTTAGVRGESAATNGAGVYGVNNTGNFGGSGLCCGVRGDTSATSSSSGVAGISVHTTGVYGQTGSGYGVFGSNGGSNSNGYAGYFNGRVHVSGTLSKSGGSFKIDHPLDPANKFLSHSFVESPDMMNIYNGNITTDASGLAVVSMPEWFEALNREFRYQLTVMGQFAQAIVESEISDNQFVIRTDKPNVKVSWQVTGVRQDAYAEAHRIPVEEDKNELERGKFLNADVFGEPLEKSIGYVPAEQVPTPVPMGE